MAQEMVERRNERRAISMFKSAYVRRGGELHFVTLRNISESGICFDAFPGVEVGSEIEFCFDSADLKTGVVKWVRDGRIGVSVGSGAFSLPQQNGKRPRAVRLPLSLKARIYVEGQCSEVAVHNLSLRGICIDNVFGMRIGQLVSIQLGDRSFELAAVRWLNTERAGICFAEPIVLREFRALVGRLQNLQENPASCGLQGISLVQCSM